ncbi:hypothetical protein [Nonomuraea sp. NPDC050783]|uniref:hypothetical protein n=1 Tax=Nonomuraea sp. NPDC050783 TaxID=3154634 RepID=UPI0034673F1D
MPPSTTCRPNPPSRSATSAATGIGTGTVSTFLRGDAVNVTSTEALSRPLAGLAFPMETSASTRVSGSSWPSPGTMTVAISVTLPVTRLPSGRMTWTSAPFLAIRWSSASTSTVKPS